MCNHNHSKTSPVRQVVIVGNDVVVQCRDEGDERAEVYWTRDDEREKYYKTFTMHATDLSPD